MESRDYMKKHYTASVKWNYLYNGKILLTFDNFVSDYSESRIYKTKAAAKAAETKFYNRMNKIYKA